VVGHLVNIGDQKLEGVKVVIDGNGLDFLVAAIPEISEFGLSGFCDIKVEGKLLPQLKAIFRCRGRHVLPESLQKLQISIHRMNIKQSKKKVPHFCGTFLRVGRN
jgi:hypothetical protein